MILGVLSDTHLPSRARCLPVGLLRALEQADLILHAGDLEGEIVEVPA